MSTINLHPPQTYSRLFRPWDNNRNTPTGSATQMMAGGSCGSEQTSDATSSIVKHETYEVSSPPIKNELTARYTGNDIDRECASISSCKSSYEDDLNNSFQRTSSPILDTQMSMQALPNPYADTANEFYQLPNHAHQHKLHATSSNAAVTATTAAAGFMPNMPHTASELYYAAASAAAVAAASSVSPSTSYSAAAVAAFGMDPYTLGLMEQEYARVMAEDAHLKALNARKQRPKKFKCPHCDVAFSNNGQLKGHIRIHTGERPFKCDVETCGKTFTRNEELTRHKRIHTGLRPYPCTACGKKFGRRDHLKKHMKTHMPQERQLGPAIFVPMYPYLYGY